MYCVYYITRIHVLCILLYIISDTLIEYVLDGVSPVGWVHIVGDGAADLQGGPYLFIWCLLYKV